MTTHASPAITDQDDCTLGATLDGPAADKYLDRTFTALTAAGVPTAQAWALAYTKLDAATDDGSYLYPTSWR
jgi:hypothetical protein